MANETLALNSGKIVYKNKLQKLNLFLQNGKITKISNRKFSADKIINCKGKIILSGLIDCHVHFRTPGQEYKEDWIT
ncbi:MAG: dihydroorotase, partial [Candidatus Diapherotrites archaeon]|nr:dihydroorotase [Candidatus Diapherotrites archaeon]